MATINYTQAFKTDVERLLDFLLTSHPEDADGLLEIIIDGLETLKHHPGIGRIYSNGLRELVISRGKSGYLALYEYNPILDRVDILRIRHQRESGYRPIE